ncbi:uncharacterized protein LOC117217352 isoform X2 [Megalopta genalis]
MKKRTSPPKILNNIPIECRPPSWKNPNWKNTSTASSTTSVTDTLPLPKSPKESAPNSSTTGTYKVAHHQTSPKKTKDGVESEPNVSGKLEDTKIPEVKLREISKTFPKMSPSRKIQNINIVFPRRPLKVSNESDVKPEEDKTPISKYDTFQVKRTGDENKMTEDCEKTPEKTNSPKKQGTDSLAAAMIACTPRTPNVTSTFPVRATSTPKFAAAVDLSSSAIFEEPLKTRKMPSKNILDKITLFEDSWSNTSTLSEKGSKSTSEETSHDSWNKDASSGSYTETLKPSQRLKNLLEKNIRSVDPTILDTVDSANSSISVKQIVKNVESFRTDQDTSAKRSALERNKSKQTSEPKIFSKMPVQQRNDAKAETKKNLEAPVTKFPRMPVQQRNDAKAETKKNLETPVTKFPRMPVQQRNDAKAETKKNLETPVTKFPRMPVQQRNDAKAETKKNLETPVIKFPRMPVQQRNDAKAEMKKNLETLIAKFSEKPVQQRNDIKAEMKKNLASPMAKFSEKPIQQRNDAKAEKKKNLESPVMKFLTTRRKSTELENVVRSSTVPRVKSVVRDIIETLAEKTASQYSLPRQNRVDGMHQSFVRSVVNTLEKRSKSVLDETIRCTQNEEDLGSRIGSGIGSGVGSGSGSGSGYESEVKSCTTSVSPKDTDSSSDTDQKSPTPENDDSHRTTDFDSTLGNNMNTQLNEPQDEDSVYWIPVSRCKLPRSSSLLSIMSKLSANTVQLPSVSPIKSDSEPENVQFPWNATYRSTRPLTKKLFRIDETAVIDSGYSDKSTRSVVGSSVADSTWSEDTKNDSSAEVGSNRGTRTSAKKPVIGISFRVQY